MIREVTETELHPKNINREEGFSPSRKPLYHDLKKRKQVLNQEHPLDAF
jgi:hypothetical protein